jgi:hypothetical protein
MALRRRLVALLPAQGLLSESVEEAVQLLLAQTTLGALADPREEVSERLWLWLLGRLRDRPDLGARVARAWAARLREERLEVEPAFPARPSTLASFCLGLAEGRLGRITRARHHLDEGAVLAEGDEMAGGEEMRLLLLAAATLSPFAPSAVRKAAPPGEVDPRAPGARQMLPHRNPHQAPAPRKSLRDGRDPWSRELISAKRRGEAASPWKPSECHC